MLSGVLRSQRAIRVNVEIMRAFVKLRQLLESNKELAKKVAELERMYGSHDAQIQQIFAALHGAKGVKSHLAPLFPNEDAR